MEFSGKGDREREEKDGVGLLEGLQEFVFFVHCLFSLFSLSLSLLLALLLAAHATDSHRFSASFGASVVPWKKNQ